MAITDNTSISIMLNSSKQAQAPHCANPLNIFAIVLVSKFSLQLNTTHYIATAFAKSLTVSVFPVPAGPYAHPPKL